MKDIFGKGPIKVLKGIGISIILLFIYSCLLTYTEIEESTIVPVLILITAVSILARKLNGSIFY